MSDFATLRYPLCFAAALALEGGAFFAGRSFFSDDVRHAIREPEHVTVELVEPPKPPPPVIEKPKPLPEKIPAKPLPPPPKEIPKPVPPREPPQQIPPPQPKPEPVVEKPRTVEPMPVVASPVPPPVVVPAPVVEKPVEVAQVVAPAPPVVEHVAARSNPAYYENPTPPYPEAARHAGVVGTVVLRVHVKADGRVERLEIQTSSGSAILDRTARDAVKHWRFEPARVGGIAVEDDVDVPIRFTLENP